MPLPWLTGNFRIRCVGRVISRKTFISIATGACVALMLVAWLALAPAQLGGSLQYVTTSGDSMEPAFFDGDLALLRSHQGYEPGDVIAYRHPEHGVVLHRIVGLQDGQFVVKGDNNRTADAYMPGSDDIIGMVWARIPAVGGAITNGAAQWLRIGAAVTVGFLALIPLGIAFPTRARHHGWQAQRVGAMFRPSRFLGLLGQTGQLLVALLTFTAVVGLVLAFVAYNRPLDREIVVPIEYEQLTDLSYSAPASESVYSQGVLNSGDPVYRALVDELIIQLEHEVVADDSVDGDGTYWIDAVVQASDGWQRSLPLREQTPYAGASLSATVSLPLDAIDETIDNFRRQAGLDSIEDTNFSVLIFALVSFDGTVAGEVIHTVTSDELVLRWNPDALYPEMSSTGNDEASSGIIETMRATENIVSLGIFDIEVRMARIAAQILLFVAVVGGLLVWLMMRHAMQTPEPLQIAARYRSRIVPIQGARQPAPSRVVALLSFDDLMRIADQKGEPILYFRRDDTHYYFVYATDVIYRVKIESDPEDRELMIDANS